MYKIDKLTEQILDITNNSDYGWIDLYSADADRIRVALTEAMNYTTCSEQLSRKSKSFTNLKTIADIQRLYPNQKSYGMSASSGLLKFYVNNKVIHTKALDV